MGGVDIVAMRCFLARRNIIQSDGFRKCLEEKSEYHDCVDNFDNSRILLPVLWELAFTGLLKVRKAVGKWMLLP